MPNAYANPVTYLDPTGNRGLSLVDTMVASTIANMLATTVGYIRSQFSANPWSADQYLLNLAISGITGAALGAGGSFAAGFLVKSISPYLAGALSGGIGSGVNQLITELTNFYINKVPITFTTVRGHVAVASAIGFVTGGMLVGVEYLSATGGGGVITSLKPAASVIPWSDATRIATSGGASAYCAVSVGGAILPCVLEKTTD